MRSDPIEIIDMIVIIDAHFHLGQETRKRGSEEARKRDSAVAAQSG